MKVVVDTNILLRPILAGDTVVDIRQREHALASLENNTFDKVVLPVVLAETLWTARRRGV